MSPTVYTLNFENKCFSQGIHSYHQGVIGVRQQTDGQMLRYGRWKRMGAGNTGGHAPRVPKSDGAKAKEAGVYPF